MLVTYSLDNASTDFAEIDSSGFWLKSTVIGWNENSSQEIKNITVWIS